MFRFREKVGPQGKEGQRQFAPSQNCHSMQLFGPTRQWTARAQDGLEDGIGHEHMVHAFCIRAHMVRRKVNSTPAGENVNGASIAS